MLDIKQKVDAFLNLYGMHYESIDMEENVQTFLDEMEKGLQGNASSLMMIPTYIKMEKEIATNKPVIVIDAGGTNFRRAVVHFDNDKKPIIEELKVFPMPGTKGSITKEEFFETVARYIEPILGRSDKISFCFSYPTEIYPNKDGQLIKFNKEVQVKGAEGAMIGENLLKAVREIGCSDEKKVILLNDTVATLLGGKVVHPDRIFDDYIGFILGTGTNTCYMEYNENIGKISKKVPPNGAMLINMESGGYGRVQTGSIDKEFDKNTANPGDHIFEKMMSGGYQGGLILSVIKKAAEEKLFREETAKKLLVLEELTSKEIDGFLYYPYGDNALARCCTSDDTADTITLYYLIDAMIERAARLVTVNLSAVMLKRSKGTNPCIPVCISAEGTTFYKSKLFRNKLEYNIRTYLNDKKGVYCEFVKADNATLIGTAIAGLAN